MDRRSLPPSMDEAQSKRILKNKHVQYEWQGLESKHIDFRQKVFTFATARGEKLTIKRRRAFLSTKQLFLWLHIWLTRTFLRNFYDEAKPVGFAKIRRKTFSGLTWKKAKEFDIDHFVDYVSFGCSSKRFERFNEWATKFYDLNFAMSRRVSSTINKLYIKIWIADMLGYYAF